MTSDPRVDAFWRGYLDMRPDNGAAERGYAEAFRFGNREEMVNRLAALVLDGTKTATSSLLWEYEHGKRVTEHGDLDIVLDWQGSPVCIIEITEVRIIPFDAVDAQFVHDYGEGDRTLAWWNTNMWEWYAAEECPGLGREPARDMPVVCERFRVVYPVPA